eukprot:10913435-Heterocapsa_arctica.AAC.1
MPPQRSLPIFPPSRTEQERGKGSGKSKKGSGALAVAFLSVSRPARLLLGNSTAQLPSALASSLRPTTTPHTTNTPPLK